MNNEFELVKLGDVTKIFAGGDKPQEFSDVKTGEYKIPIYANGETNSGLQGFAKIARVNEPAVTVSARGTIGYTALRIEPFVPIVRLLTLIPDIKRIDILYLYYYLKLHRQTGIGSSQAQLIAPEIANRTITLPNLSIQKSIGKVLSSLDSKIEINNKINAELEAMARTIYDYWFVQFDFPNAKGKPYKTSGGKIVWNEELKREIPGDWDSGILSDLGDIQGGSTPSRDIKENFDTNGISWITPKDLSENTGNKFITKGEVCVSEMGMKSASLKTLPKGSVLMSSRAPVGYMAIAREPLTTNQGFKSFVPKKDYSTPFIFYTVKNAMPEIINNASGSTFKEISGGTLKTIKICLPKKEIIKSYTAKVESIFDRQNLLEIENQQLSELRDWLLPMLMNGQVAVCEVEKAVNEKMAIAAEPEVTYEKSSIVKLPIPETKKSFAKQVLAGKIMSLFREEKEFTDIKFQKIQYLAEHIAEADLNLNYYRKMAGPYDNVFMHTVYSNMKNNKWFEDRKKNFKPLAKVNDVDKYYQTYFSTAETKLNKLFNLLKNASEAHSEVIATVYAIWNNLLINGETPANSKIVKQFFEWSTRKEKYTQKQIIDTIKWLKDKGFEPTGFGYLIKEVKK
ncbi:MAG: restriction endonuclease subunit S [Bacteroidota bacterium]